MRVLVIDEREVHALLSYAECITVMEEALTALARDEADNPLRSKLSGRGASGLLGLMPAYRGGNEPIYALKEVCVFPGNRARGLDSHLGAVLLHSGTTGELIAIVNASAITAIRTAAVSALATRLLAREEASVLAILGSGTQAEAHLAAIPLVRPIREVRIYSRSRAAGPHTASSAEKAVRGADIIVTATNSREPVLLREWVADGAHINAVGSSIASARELDAATVGASSLFVDRRESTINESGDYLFALREGAIVGPQHIRAEIGEILTGRAQGRHSPTEITLFKSLGLAVEDLYAAAFVFEKAGRMGAGTLIDF
ncbi:MAG: ornithine cyclodeaminase family protein [Thermoanaerobaculia bacterium]|nr:ornithine cyclodeaminase family protein [Thermoanaerobaculia bacterium]